MTANIRPNYDPEITAIARYALQEDAVSQLAIETAYYDLLDSMACAIQALAYPACTKLLGPLVAEMTMANGTPIIGTSYKLDPVQAAFNLGAMIRWLDFNDTWLAAEWGHPSDNLGALLATGDYLNRHRNTSFTVRNILNYMIKAHEIQGILALENSFNRVGLDHVLLVKIASAACAGAMLGLKQEQLEATISHAIIDGQALRTYRHSPNTGPRKSWAAGDATARGLRLALMVQAGEIGYPSALSAPIWGFSDVSFKGQPLQRHMQYGSYVMENILWKISFPAEFHAQTAVECAIHLHPEIKDRLDQIERIEMETQQAAMRIIDKKGPLHNPADRDHCIQYMSAVGLIFGELTAAHYEESYAKDPRIDHLREKMVITENIHFSKDYLDPDKRSIANSMQIVFKDGSCSQKITIDYPVGHKRRRDEGIPLLINKFECSVNNHYSKQQSADLISLCLNRDDTLTLPLNDFMDKLSIATL